jgi:transketolase
MVRLGHTVADYVSSLASADDRIWVVDGDLGDSYGLDEPAIEKLGDRFIQAGIAEQTMVGLAAGLAACDLRPFVFSFAAFLCCRAYDQIRVCVSQTELPVVFVGSHAGGCNGANGKTHSIINDVAIMSTLSNIEVWAPADAGDAVYAVNEALRSSKATYIRLPRDSQRVLPGEANLYRWFGTPAPVAIVSTGLGTQWAFEVRELLLKAGIEIPVLHLARLTNFPHRELAQHLSRADSLIVIEDHYEIGGLADVIRRHFPEPKIISAGWPQNWTGASGEADVLRVACGIDNKILVERCLRVLKQTRSIAAAAT